MIKHLYKISLIFAIFISICYSAISDATWNAVIQKQIIIELDDSREIAGTIISYQDSIITMVKSDGYVTSIEAGTVNSIKMNIEQPTIKRDKTFTDKSFQKEKTFGPVMGFGPGIIGFNADIKDVNLFTSASFIIPILTEGEAYAFTFGAGKLVGIGNHGWKFNLFSNFSIFNHKIEVYDTLINDEYPTKWENNYAVGAGVGFQYTTTKGILISFKIPVIGFSFSNNNQGGIGVVKYYPHSGASLPVIVFGKSF